MQDLQDKKIAIVCDWIKDWGGAELVLEQLLEIFPEAHIFTSVYFPKNENVFKGRKITTSFIQYIPFLSKSHKLALTLRPRAFENFDLSEYDIVISSSSAESKGVITKPETLQICYCHTPTRYFWSHYHEYLNMMEFGILNPIGKWLMPKIVHSLRKWDFLAAQRPDFFLANSENTASRIKKYYGREAKVLYPGIDVENYVFSEKKEDFYLYVGRCIPYKKFDLIVEAFNENGKKAILVTNTKNKLLKSLQKKSKENIVWKIGIGEKETKELFSKTKAFLFPPEEDFGIVPIEAMISGTPVIAFAKGGALETVCQGKTGVFFEEQSVESLNEAIEKFESLKFEPKKLKKEAEKFNKERFRKELLEFINEKLKF